MVDDTTSLLIITHIATLLIGFYLGILWTLAWVRDRIDEARSERRKN